MPRRKKVETALEIIPPKTITLTEDQFRELGEKIESSRKPNPLPWVIVGLALVLFAVVGGMGLIVAIMKPTPIPIVLTLELKTDTPIPTVTRTNTPTLTPTKDIMVDMQVINNYYKLLSVGDMESAWNCLTLKFRRDSWGNDFEEFKDHWSRTGPVAVYEIIPEKESGGEATALVRLYFYYEQRIRYYRFHLQYNPLDKIFQIDSVDNARPW